MHFLIVYTGTASIFFDYLSSISYMSLKLVYGKPFSLICCTFSLLKVGKQSSTSMQGKW